MKAIIGSGTNWATIISTIMAIVNIVTELIHLQDEHKFNCDSTGSSMSSLTNAKSGAGPSLLLRLDRIIQLFSPGLAPCMFEALKAPLLQSCEVAVN